MILSFVNLRKRPHCLIINLAEKGLRPPVGFKPLVGGARRARDSLAGTRARGRNSDFTGFRADIFPERFRFGVRNGLMATIMRLTGALL
jgi:hypothetical protein